MKAVPGPVVQIDEGRIQAHLDEVVRATVEETLNGLLDAEADRLCGARKYERTEGRKDTRAGSYDRHLQTKAGEVTLTVPKLRNLPFETAIIERYRRRESSVEEALIVLGRRERAARGRHHTGAVGHAGLSLDGQRSEPEDLRQDQRVAGTAAGGRFPLCLSRWSLAQAQLGR
jgi:hypothetical protein